MRWSLWMALPIVALHASVAQAAETGDLRGKITTEDGAGIPGATVTISGPSMGGEVVAQTDEDGWFRVVTLPPGRHTVTVMKEGFTPVRLEIGVRLGETAQFTVSLTESTISEVVVVEGIQPVIDTTKSSVSHDIDAEMMQNLPVGRSYTDVVQMLPGIYGRVNTDAGGPGGANPSVRGEGQYGNNYYVDGISARDPATKTAGNTAVNFDAIQSIQVYTDGAPAEFGNATGMMVNVITKDGGDEHHGSVGYWLNTHASGGTYDILNLDTGEEEPTTKRKFLNHELSATVGGPILKEKLWYFAAITGNLNNIVFEGGDPDFPLVSRGGDAFAKATWFATPDITLQYEINGQYLTIENEETSSLIAPEAQTERVQTMLAHILTGRWRPDAMSELELKASYQPSRLDVVPVSGDKEAPIIIDEATGERYNNADTFDYNTRRRMGAQLSFTRLFEDVGGDHRVKTGVSFFRLYDARELLWTGGDPQGHFDGIQYQADTANGLPCTTDTNGDGIRDDCAGFQGSFEAGELGHSANHMGFYIQDDWSPIEQLTANLGFRIDNEVMYQNEGEKVWSTLMPAPRLGLAFDVLGDATTLITANYGWYYDVHGSGLGQWADSATHNIFHVYEAGTGPNGPNVPEDPFENYVLVHVQDPEASPLTYCTEQSLGELRTHLIEDLGFSEEAADADVAKANDVCGEGFKPYHNEKLVLGVEREIIPFLAIGVKGIISRTVNLPEDYDITLDTWVISSNQPKRRDYRALEFALTKKFDERWGAIAAYTLSESKGHLPGQFERPSGGSIGGDGNGVGLYGDSIGDPETRQFYFDNGFGWLVDGLDGLGTYNDDQGYYGYLPYHSFHAIKLNGFYTFPFGTTIGLVYEFDSGHAWQKRGLNAIYGDYYNFPEGRGSRLMPSTHYIDFRVGHTVEFAEDQQLEVTLDLFNLPDLQSPITYYENDNPSFGKTLYRQAPRSLRAGVRYNF